jgi:hypothetical protein
MASTQDEAGAEEQGGQENSWIWSEEGQLDQRDDDQVCGEVMSEAGKRRPTGESEDDCPAPELDVGEGCYDGRHSGAQEDEHRGFPLEEQQSEEAGSQWPKEKLQVVPQEGEEHSELYNGFQGVEAGEANEQGSADHGGGKGFVWHPLAHESRS